MPTGLVLERQAGLMYNLCARQIQACTAAKAGMLADRMPAAHSWCPSPKKGHALDD